MCVIYILFGKWAHVFIASEFRKPVKIATCHIFDHGLIRITLHVLQVTTHTGLRVRYQNVVFHIIALKRQVILYKKILNPLLLLTEYSFMSVRIRSER